MKREMDSDDDVAAEMVQSGITLNLVKRKNAEKERLRSLRILDGDTSTEDSSGNVVVDTHSKYDMSGAVVVDGDDGQHSAPKKKSIFDLLSVPQFISHEQSLSEVVTLKNSPLAEYLKQSGFTCSVSAYSVFSAVGTCAIMSYGVMELRSALEL